MFLGHSIPSGVCQRLSQSEHFKIAQCNFGGLPVLQDSQPCRKHVLSRCVATKLTSHEYMCTHGRTSMHNTCPMESLGHAEKCMRSWKAFSMTNCQNHLPSCLHKEVWPPNLTFSLQPQQKEKCPCNLQKEVSTHTHTCPFKKTTLASGIETQLIKTAASMSHTSHCK